ncbi:hypothetical protein IWZ00DRAFT_493840 [Phyllosticta capitalensis]|uniref:uncharacterized protein n=1 Tax=Phyllosticta capitalensis TaxID=121624 RepID=UPI00312D3697
MQQQESSPDYFSRAERGLEACGRHRRVFTLLSLLSQGKQQVTNHDNSAKELCARPHDLFEHTSFQGKNATRSGLRHIKTADYDSAVARDYVVLHFSSSLASLNIFVTISTFPQGNPSRHRFRRILLSQPLPVQRPEKPVQPSGLQTNGQHLFLPIFHVLGFRCDPRQRIASWTAGVRSLHNSRWHFVLTIITYYPAGSALRSKNVSWSALMLRQQNGLSLLPYFPRP